LFLIVAAALLFGAAKGGGDVGDNARGGGLLSSGYGGRSVFRPGNWSVGGLAGGIFDKAQPRLGL